MAYLPDDNLLYPVLIEIGGSGGSGFYCNTKDSIFVVTAKHVLFDENGKLIADAAKLLSTGSDKITQINLAVQCDRLLKSGHLKPHPTADVAVAKIGSLTGGSITMIDGVQGIGSVPKEVATVGLPIDAMITFDETKISNTVFVFGYPMSLANAHIKSNLPLLRRGIVAGKTTDQKIVIDVPVYFGNSGGLVIEVEDLGVERQYRGIGIATNMVPFVEELHSKQFRTLVGLRHENSGYAIVEPMDRVKELF